MAVHFHDGNPCTICGFPLQGGEAIRFVNGNIMTTFNVSLIHDDKDINKDILKLIDDYWKFDNDQQPISSWHDKQNLLKAVEDLLKTK